MKNNLYILYTVTLFSLLLSSCAINKNERSHYFPGTEELKRTDYEVVGDRMQEETVSTSFGFIHSSQTGKNYKKGVIGNISREGGSILVGNFKINLGGFVTASALSFGTSYLITKWSGTNNNRSSNNYGNPRIPFKFSIIPGTIIGLGINNLISASPTQKAIDLANFNFLENNKSDYLLNPRYEIKENSTFFKKTATVKMTSKGINIKPDIK
jgi:hypothetical protein